jgi:hypothetical protein
LTPPKTVVADPMPQPSDATLWRDLMHHDLLVLAATLFVIGAVATAPFQERRWYASGSTESSVAVGDLNNEWTPDLAVTTTHEDCVRVLPDPRTRKFPEEVAGVVLDPTGLPTPTRSKVVNPLDPATGTTPMRSHSPRASSQVARGWPAAESSNVQLRGC